MKIKTITVQRVKNLGNFESERLEITGEVPDNGNEAYETYVILLKSKVWELLNTTLPESITHENPYPF